MRLPSALMGALTAENLKNATVRVVGVNWETFDFMCSSEACRHHEHAYGNYISRLEDENKMLHQRMKESIDIFDEDEVES